MPNHGTPTAWDGPGVDPMPIRRDRRLHGTTDIEAKIVGGCGSWIIVGNAIRLTAGHRRQSGLLAPGDEALHGVIEQCGRSPMLEYSDCDWIDSNDSDLHGFELSGCNKL